MENDFSGGGLQPVRDAPGAAAPFLPVTRRDRLLCVLLVSVIVVCGYHAACGVPALVKAMGSSAAESEDVPLETEPLEVGAVPSDDAESATLDVEEVPIVRGDDGREYYVIGDLLELGADDEPFGEESFASRELSQVHGLAQSDASTGLHGEVRRDAARYGECLSGLRTQDGRDVYEDSQSGEQRPELRHCIEDGLESCSIGAGRFAARFTVSGIVGCDYNGFGIAAQELVDTVSLYSDNLRSGVYHPGTYGNRNDSFLAAGGNPLVVLAQRAHAKFVTSAVGRKLMASAFAPLIGFAVQSAGMTAMDEALSEELAEAIALQNSRAIAIVADTTATDIASVESRFLADITMVSAQRMFYNAENGIVASTEETAAMIADDFLAYEAGETVACETPGFLNMLEDLAAGYLATDLLPFWANAGEQILENAGILTSPFSDAEGFLTTEGGKFGEYVDVAGSLYVQGTYPAGHPRAGQPSDTMRHNLNLQNGRYVTDWYLWQDTGVITYQSGWTNYSMNCDCVYVQGKVYSPSSDSFSWTARYYAPAPLVKLEMPNAATHYLGVASNPSTSQLEIADSDLVDLTRQGVSNFFESGGQLVGNDAQYGDGGEIIDSGHANILDSVYGDGDYSTWADALSAGELQAVKPSGESEANASDEVVEGSGKGSTVGESTGKSNPPTAPQLMYSIDANMGDLQDAVSDKFPFSIPFNVSRTVDMLIASPEAPHFTWVFALPTGNVEYEVDLSPFSPVAHVLRVMLDVLMVFVVISLLGKIAQVWGFFDKAAD